MTRALSADLNADGRPDVLVPCADGQLLLLLNLPGESGMPHFLPSLGKGSHQGAIEIDLGRFGPTLVPRLIWLDRNGALFAAAIKLTGSVLQTGTPQRLLDIGPGAHLAVGRFLGHISQDIIAGRRLLPDGESGRAIELSILPGLADSSSDPWWRSADIDGNGMDDLIRKRVCSDREGGAGDCDPLFGSKGRPAPRLSRYRLRRPARRVGNRANQACGNRLEGNRLQARPQRRHRRARAVRHRGCPTVVPGGGGHRAATSHRSPSQTPTARAASRCT